MLPLRTLRKVTACHRVWGSNHYIYNGPKRFFSY
jgi:hypothetical protein